MSNIALRIVNKSKDTQNSTILIFQKNVVPSLEELVIAWRVVRNLGLNCSHPFIYEDKVQVCMNDAFGNFSPRLDAFEGQAFKATEAPSGHVLSYDGDSSSGEEIEIRNGLDEGSINAQVFRSGSLIAAKTNVVPMQKAVFSFNPILYFAVVSQVEQSRAIDSAILSEPNTEINLIGVKRADIVLRGGGYGRSARPYKFTLENIEYA